MTLEELARTVLGACDAEPVDHTVTGAFAVSVNEIPRFTKDVDVLISLTCGDLFQRVVSRLKWIVEFDPQVQFDPLPWGRRFG